MERMIPTRGEIVQRLAPIVPVLRADDGEDETGDGWTITGVACATEQWYEYGDVEYWGWYEQVAKGAFKETLANKPDVILNLNHSRDSVLARTTSTRAPLTLYEDDKGLCCVGKMAPDDPDAQRARAKLLAGTMTQMSFAFRIMDYELEDEDDEDKPMKLTITEVDLEHGDVSLVTYPASPHTSAKLRDNDVLAYEELAEYWLDVNAELQLQQAENKVLRNELAQAKLEQIRTATTVTS